MLGDDHVTVASMFGNRTPSFVPDVLYEGGETVGAGGEKSSYSDRYNKKKGIKKKELKIATINARQTFCNG